MVPLCVMAEVGIRCGQLLVGSVGWKLLAFSAEARQGAACFVKQSHAELTAVEWHQGRSRLSGRGADCLTSHAHRQHTVSLLLFYAGEGVVQDLVSSSFFCMRSGADTCQPHGSVSRLLRRIF